MYAGRPYVLLERGWIAFRSTNWIPVVTGFVEPVLFLLAFGYGMGNLVGDVTTGNTTMDYTLFIAPGLLANSAMNGAIYGNSMNPSCIRPCSQLHLDLLISHWVKSPGP
jgi:lipooligosaccharide transport system permease protein